MYKLFHNPWFWFGVFCVTLFVVVYVATGWVVSRVVAENKPQSLTITSRVENKVHVGPNYGHQVTMPTNYFQGN